MTDRRSLPDNLIAAAAQWPGRCAIQDGETTISYSSLLHEVRLFASRLVLQGFEQGNRLAIALPNSIEFVTAYYGTLMAGGIAVLMNVAGKAVEFSAWLTDCDASYLCYPRGNQEIDRALASMVKPPGHLLPSAPGVPGASADPGVLASLTIGRNDPACILYTSGTTGKPKGVVLSHGNLLSNTEAIVSFLGLTSTDSIVTVLPFYYAFGSSVLHSHIGAGGRIVLEKNLLYPHAVVDTLVKEQATGFAGVPSTYALLLARVKLDQFDLSSLRYFAQAGGPMSPTLTQRLRDAVPHAAVFVMYGQTEATARLTYLPPDRLADKMGSVGVPVSGVQIQIRREDSTLANVDEIGEVWACGPNIMLGYWRNALATAEVKDGRWLNTGDVGRVDADGFLFIAGRRSDIIKAGAHRVHPQDIEDVIAELPQVQEVAVIGEEDELLGEAIKAFVVQSTEAVLSQMQIQAHCRSRLASYKVPRTVEFVAALPKTPNGKIRRNELSARLSK